MAYGRKRTIGGWSCLGASALLAAVLLVSSRYTVNLSWAPAPIGQGASYVISVLRGSIVAGWMAPSRDSGDIELRRDQDFELEWWYGFDRSDGHGNTVRSFGLVKLFTSIGRIEAGAIYILIWPLILLTLTPGVPLLLSGRRAARRARVGCCAACGYDRAATPREAPCPECGVAKTL